MKFMTPRSVCGLMVWKPLTRFSNFPIGRIISAGGSLQRRHSSCNTGTMAANRPKVYITRNVPEIAIELLKPRYEVTQWDSDEPVPRMELLQRVPGIDALFCLLTDKIDSDVLDAAGDTLKSVCTMSVGYDHIDVQECKRRNLPIGYTPDVLTDATAELTVSLLLATSRRILEGVDAVKTGEWSSWKPLWMCGPGLANSTVGIVGLGRIGLGVAQRLKPFGPKDILYSGHTKKQCGDEIGACLVTFDELLSRSDFVIATCPLSSDTREMFNKDAFSKMKNTAVFVNTSRGAIVDQDALHEALVSGQIFAAGLDVTVPEPLPTDHPLLGLKNCVILPHIGSATHQARSTMAEITARNVIAVLEGQTMPAELHAKK